MALHRFRVRPHDRMMRIYLRRHYLWSTIVGLLVVWVICTICEHSWFNWFVGEHDFYIKYNPSNQLQSSGCSNIGFKEQPWCRTECWNGTDFFIPEKVIEPSCSDYSQRQYIMYAYSKTYNFPQREALREQFKYHLKSLDIALMFVVAYPPNIDAKNESILSVEIGKYHDILRLNFSDTYDNLSYKGLGVFNWIKQCGTNVEYIIKVDDDNRYIMGEVYVGYHFIHSRNFTSARNTILCMRSGVNNIIHEQKWKKEYTLTYNEYPGEKMPRYCLGDRGTFLPKEIAIRLLEAAKSTKVLRIEDAYLTGLLRLRACIHINRLNTPLFYIVYVLYSIIFNPIIAIIYL